MADYVNTENTIGFYKFSKDDLNTNSILNSSISDLGSSLRTPNDSSGSYILTRYPDLNLNTNLIKYNQKYKSRPSSLLIPESNAIYLPTKNIGSSMTVEFWFYPKKGTNEIDPSSNYNAYTPVYLASGYSAHSSLWKTSNPFLYSYEIIPSTISVPSSGQDVIKTHTTSGTYKNLSIYSPIWVYISYCCYRKGFYISMFSNYEDIIGASNNGTNSSTSNKEVSSYSFNKYPPNKWYHVAITQDNNSLGVFINGKRIFKNAISVYKSTYSYNGQRIYTTYPSFTPFNNPSMYVMSIGNRTSGTNNNIINYSPIYGEDNPNTGYCDKPGFQDIIIDDLRVSQGILYTENFIPPGISGYQILNVDDKIYGYNDSGEFVLMDDNWSTKTNDQKKTTLDSLSLFDIDLDDIKSVVNDQNNDIHIEVYDDSSTKSCKLYTDSYDETIIPSTLLQIPSEEQILKNITFISSISVDSYIKVLVTTDLVTYKTYNFELNSWVNTPIEDISSYGILIDQVNNIPEEDVELLGDKFAFAYYLHLQPYESDCSIEQLNVDVAIEYAQKHCNQSIANYEYPMFNKLKVIFYEDGEFKVNYMDKP